tara:strand:+ start:7127 stop:7462 length:336 start_codon:yes stop_codon:yes gene_type:complete
MTWPPTNQTYKAFRKELKQACREHPPFKLWLIKKRNKNLLLSCYHDLKYAAFMHTVKDLKEMYIAESEKYQNAVHMIRFMANHYHQDATAEEKTKLEHVMIQTKMKSNKYF